MSERAQAKLECSPAWSGRLSVLTNNRACRHHDFTYSFDRLKCVFLYVTILCSPCGD